MFQPTADFSVTIPELTCEDEQEISKDIISRRPVSRLFMTANRSTRLHGTPDLMNMTSYTSRSKVLGSSDSEGPLTIISKLKTNFKALEQMFNNLGKPNISQQRFASLVSSILPELQTDKQNLMLVFNLLVEDKKIKEINLDDLRKIVSETERLCFEAETFAEMKSRDLLLSQVNVRPTSVADIIIMKSRKPSILKIGENEKFGTVDIDMLRPTTSMTVRVKPRLPNYQRKSCPRKRISIPSADNEQVLKRLNRRLSIQMNTPDQTRRSSPKLTLTSRLRAIFNNKIVNSFAISSIVSQNSLQLEPASSKLDLHRDFYARF